MWWEIQERGGSHGAEMGRRDVDIDTLDTESLPDEVMPSKQMPKTPP